MTEAGRKLEFTDLEIIEAMKVAEILGGTEKLLEMRARCLEGNHYDHITKTWRFLGGSLSVSFEFLPEE